ncbi:MAG: 23S rRNA (guanosine(2251)-2'-O)-methyltransferase RlmB, partial [Legionellales bacterium]|nr:23S rRNA (guanosine(2251)-2'-O)-methyltransferase RlmB [Legionellales bacterium]
KELHKVDFPNKTGLVLGSEHTGLRRLTKESCDEIVQINLSNGVESLNASVAAGIFIYMAQRR